MATPAIPTGVAGLTPAWLTTVLARDGAGTVTDVGISPIGTGQVADSARLSLVWDPPGSGPATLVAKVTAADETSRAAAAATRTYEVEVGFYTDLAASLPVRAPRCYHAAFDAATLGYVVLLEDLAPAQQGDQLTGCSAAEARASLDELAHLHAPRWGDPSLAAIPWLARHGPAYPDELGMLVGMLFPGFVERYASSLGTDVLDLAERFVPRLPAYVRAQEPPFTIVHGDFRVDNLLFGDGRVGVVDWQTVALGPALADVSYLLGASLPTPLRRAEEDALVRHYHERLTAGGVELDWPTCWTGYRRYAFAGLVMAIVASMVVRRTERGDEMFVAMAERHGRHALDVDAEALLPPPH
jgi:aminoglycoside/choline kinase family phosphotransferase